MTFSLSFAVFFFALATSAANFVPEFKVDGRHGGLMEAGQPARWELKFYNEDTGEAHHHFMRMHGKLLHMIVVSEDLEHFAHIHPTFSHMTRTFSIQVNAVAAPDPDNLDVTTAVPYPGRFQVFTETMPHVEETETEMPMLYSRFPILAQSALEVFKFPRLENLWPKRLGIVKSSTNNKQLAYFDGDGRPASHGSRYRARFSYDQLRWCSWYLPKYYLNLDVWDEERQDYFSATNLQEWLTMGGHAVAVSRDEKLEDRAFYHLHAMLPVVTPGEFVLPYDDHFNPMRDGDYRMFIQFKEDNVVRKIHFDFIYTNPPPPDDGMLPLSCLNR